MSVVNAVVDGRLSEAAYKAAESPEEYELEIAKIKKNRSLNANALLWACLQEIANALRADKWDIYLKMLKRYGQFDYAIIKPKAVETFKKQWRECEEIGPIHVNEKEVGIQMLCYYGSSTYDSREFSILLDGVISEMKEMGLETPEDEVMKEALRNWQK